MIVFLRHFFVLIIVCHLNYDSTNVHQKEVIHKFDFYTQYNQFYLSDKNSPRHTDSENFWTKEAYKERLAVEKGILGVGTQSYGHIKGELVILQEEKRRTDFKEFDHVVEGAMVLKSGTLQMLDCPNSKIELEIHLKPGIYRVKIFSSNLVGSNGDENEGKDHYLIEIWPGSYLDRTIVKQYKGI